MSRVQGLRLALDAATVNSCRDEMAVLHIRYINQHDKSVIGHSEIDHT